MPPIRLDHIAIALPRIADAPAALEPVGTDGFLHRFLAAHGRGVHHVTFKVPDPAEVCARAERAGYAIVGRGESDRSWKEAFLHPKQALGSPS